MRWILGIGIVVAIVGGIAAWVAYQRLVPIIEMVDEARDTVSDVSGIADDIRRITGAIAGRIDRET